MLVIVSGVFVLLLGGLYWGWLVIGVVGLVVVVLLVWFGLLW